MGVRGAAFASIIALVGSLVIGIPAAATDRDSAESASEATATPDYVPVTVTERERSALEASVRSMADERALLPLTSKEGSPTCPMAQIRVSYDRNKYSNPPQGAIIEPLIQPHETHGVEAVGFAYCRSSDIAIMGFDAVWRNGVWKVWAVPAPHGGGHEAHSEHPRAHGPHGENEPDDHVDSDTEGPPEGDSPRIRALSVPPPSFPSNLPQEADPLAPLDSASGCIAGERRGARALRSLLINHYPGTRDLGIVRACSVGGNSEHKEGRAFDWGVDAYNATEREYADSYLAWLLGSDPYGNAYGAARRQGVMNAIWNGRIWGAYRADAGWRTYTGPSPHTDHVHFSLSWDGAACQTSWWVATDCTGEVPSTTQGRDGLVFYRESSGAQRSYEGSPDGGLGQLLNSTAWSSGWSSITSLNLSGSVNDGLLTYRSSSGSFRIYDRVTEDGAAGLINTGQWGAGWDLVSGFDFDGDGRESFLFYRANDGRFRIYQGTSGGTLGGEVNSGNWASGWDSISTIDFDGDGTDELLFYRASDGRFRAYSGTSSGGLGQLMNSGNWSAGWDSVAAVDFDGDGNDEILFYREDDGRFRIYPGTAGGSLGGELANGTWSTNWTSIIGLNFDR